MKLDDVSVMYIIPALRLLPPKMDSDEAIVMLLTIGLQESRFRYRTQIGGPARSYWQFERGGGVRGVVSHHASAGYIGQVAERLDYELTTDTLHNAMAYDGVLAACMARLLLWTDPYPLPVIDDTDGAWDLYLRVWRPGKPHPDTWRDLHRQAVEHI